MRHAHAYAEKLRRDYGYDQIEPLDRDGIRHLILPSLVLAVVPTTAGTGSEVTLVAVIRDEGSGRKVPFTSPFLLPQLAVLDPRLTQGLPLPITAATAMDAMTHAIEAFIGNGKNPVSDALALMATAYTELGQEQLAADARKVLEANYPDHAYLRGDWPDDRGFFGKLNPFGRK